jgi:hypothetical protein
MQILHNGLPEAFGGSLYAYVHWPFGVWWSQWVVMAEQLLTAVCDEGDGMTLCE